MADRPPHAQAARGWQFLRNPPQPTAKVRVDGCTLTDAEDKRLNSLFHECFATPAGKQVLAHLRSISVDMVMGPGADDGALRHLEGQRYLFAVIQNRSKGSS